MKALLTYLVENITSHPDQVSLQEETENDTTIFYLQTHPDDTGKIIGKKGKTIRAIRNLLHLKDLVKKTKTRLYLKEAEAEKISS